MLLLNTLALENTITKQISGVIAEYASLRTYSQYSNVHLGNNFCKGAVQWNATCKHVR